MNETTREIARLIALALEAEDSGDSAGTQRLYERCLELDDGSDSSARDEQGWIVRLRLQILYGTCF